MAITILQGQAEKMQHVHYEVDVEMPPLGVGGMGTVYRGVRVDEQSGTRRAVAIKFLYDDLGDGAIERSRREASIHIQNENLVEMFGFIEIPDPRTGAMHYHVVSELLEGVMLYDLLESGQTTDKLGRVVPRAQELLQMRQAQPERFAATITKAVLSGIMAMHDLGYIHRDIDPSNIMITQDGKIKLIDYGIAKNIRNQNPGHSLTSTGSFMGKAAYAAPELVTGDVAHQNETTDIYAIGIMLFQLLTGKRPFEGADHEILEKQMKSPLPLQEVRNQNMRNVVDHATRKHQGERYLSAAEFRVDIERAERGQAVSPGMRTSYPQAREGQSRTGRKVALWLIGGIAALFVLAVLGVVGLLVIGANSTDDTGGEETAQEYTLPTQGNIIDSYDVNTVTDEGTTYHTMGKVVQDAEGSLTSVEGVRNAVQSLQDAVNTGFPSASAAALLLSRIYRQDELTPSQKQYVSQAIGEPDYGTAYEMALKAYELDKNNPEVLFEMGNVYYGGPGYTAEKAERDLEKALTMYTDCETIAKEAGNNNLASMARQRITQLQEAMAPAVEEVTEVEMVEVPKAETKRPAPQTKPAPQVQKKKEPEKVYDDSPTFF